MRKLDLATNIVLINYCMTQVCCDNCRYKSKEENCCTLYRYVSVSSKFFDSNKIMVVARGFCSQHTKNCRHCEYRQRSRWGGEGSCSTNILSVKYSEMKGNDVL